MMHISDTFKDMIVEEVDFVIQQMQQSANELEKLYYFSGVYALFQRIFNIEYNTNLVYVHFILRSTHETFIQRIKAIQSGDTTVPLCKEQSEKLLELTQELRDKRTFFNSTLISIACRRVTFRLYFSWKM